MLFFFLTSNIADDSNIEGRKHVGGPVLRVQCWGPSVEGPVLGAQCWGPSVGGPVLGAQC